jgi:hypothetical protein
MRGFILKMIGFELQIDEDEIPVVLDGVQRGVVKILKRGIMNPSSFAGIIDDPKREKDREVDAVGVYTGKMTVKPLTDLFPKVREEVEKLSVQKRLTP